jgi:transcriptional regulator with XRE-family HTH domain
MDRDPPPLIQSSQHRRSADAAARQAAIAAVISSALQRSSWSLRTVCRAIGLKGHASVSAYLRGRGSVSDATLFKILDVLQATESENRIVLDNLMSPELRERLARFCKRGPDASSAGE